jgi:hypothetical protein
MGSPRSSWKAEAIRYVYRWCGEDELEAEVDHFDGTGFVAVAEASAVRAVKGGEKAGRVEGAGGDGQLVGLAGVAHVQDSLGAEAGKGEAFGLEFGASPGRQVGTDIC